MSLIQTALHQLSCSIALHCVFPLDVYQSNFAGGLTAPKGGSGSSPGGPVRDAGAPPVPFAYGAYAPNQYAAGSQVMYRQAPGSATSWNAAAVSGPSQAASGLPQAATGVGVFPPQQSYVGGQLENYMANIQHGDSKRQTEEMSSLLPPPPPPGQQPTEEYKGGELSTYSSVFEHGDNARETEEQGQPPYRPYFGVARDAVAEGAVAVAPAPVAPAFPSRGFFYPPGPIGVDPRTYYLFMTGQLPPGTFSHASLSHEAGGNHYGEAHYERFGYPTGPQPRLTETPEVSSDVRLQQQPRDNRKGY